MHRNPTKAKAMQTAAFITDPDAGFNENWAAEFLGVSVRTLQAWRVRGEGPRFVKVGRAVRYRRRELVAFQKSRTFSSTTEFDDALRNERKK